MSSNDLLGRLAVHYKMISMEQLQQATQEQGRTPQRMLGDILVGLNLINESQKVQLLEAQRQYTETRQQKAKAESMAPPKPEPAPPPPPPRDPTPTPAVRAPASGTLIGQVAPAAAAAPAAAPAAPAAATGTGNPRVDWLHRVLTHASSSRASDIHVHANSPVKIRVNGSLRDLTPDSLSAKDTDAIIRASLTEEQIKELDEVGEIDFAYEVRNVGRFRSNVNKQYAGLCAVYHYIPPEIPDLIDLGLPTTLARLTNYRNGLVLVTGPAGSGKTTTMAALINIINEERTDHILSLEDPIEYIHKSKRCLVNQREVGRHTKSFSNALKSALREDPDVIVIGEMRDLETISLALTAAETGHLVLGTLHTLGAVRTINRIIGAYPPTQQGQIRAMLSESLRAVVSQLLLPSIDGGPMGMAYELLLVNHAAGNLIRENRTFQLASVMQTGRAAGMSTIDESLARLVKEGRISKETAHFNALNKALFR